MCQIGFKKKKKNLKFCFLLAPLVYIKTMLFFLTEAESLSVYRMFAKTEEINTIKMEFNMGRFTEVFRSSSNITLQYDIMPGFLIRE